MSVNELFERSNLIEGRNLIEFGDFSGRWSDFWAVTGSYAVRQDNETGKTYLQMIEGATVTQTFQLPVRPDEDAVYWFSFAYEVVGDQPSRVTLTTDDGKVVFDERFSSRKSQEDAGTSDDEVRADLMPYPPIAIKGLSRSDTKIDLMVTSADNGRLGGINVTDFKIDLRIDPLKLSEMSLDGRSIPVAV
ncbi:hypothetical protein [Pseudomonas sp. GM48]|uniref:hypothetical protein n=1 Tax=Pseudomonas sp. GM48 TaxID=1144330 RepID=UPI0002704A19|nr:hypothetical protein [Pseudomonas sp. GM48]EJM58103.1 hypothetical protein PMI28_02468 [Pseudomonas sp. GM48]